MGAEPYHILLLIAHTHTHRRAQIRYLVYKRIARNVCLQFRYENAAGKMEEDSHKRINLWYNGVERQLVVYLYQAQTNKLVRVGCWCRASNEFKFNGISFNHYNVYSKNLTGYYNYLRDSKKPLRTKHETILTQIVKCNVIDHIEQYLSRYVQFYSKEKTNMSRYMMMINEMLQSETLESSTVIAARIYRKFNKLSAELRALTPSKMST